MGDRVVLAPRPRALMGRSRSTISFISRFDLHEVFRRERLFPGEVVEEAILDDRADRHLRAGEEFLDGLGKHVRCVVARSSSAAPPDRARDVTMPILASRSTTWREVLHLAVDAQGQRRLGRGRARSRRRCRRRSPVCRTIGPSRPVRKY